MPEHHSRFKRFIEKFLKSHSTEAENRFLTRYYDYFDKEKDITDELSDEQKEKVMLEMRAHIYQFAANTPPRSKIRNILPWSMVAALLLIIGGSIWQRSFLINLLHPNSIQHQITRLGERKEIQLPDGTHIWLAPGSDLTYPTYFRGQAREVSIEEGEAFFEVAKDPRHPFIIHNNQLNTQVIGTSFNIKAYKTERDISVTVLTGEVAVTEVGKTNRIILQPNQRALYDKEKTQLTREDYPEARQLMDRKDGIMEYREVALSDVMNDLSRQYNVKIEFIEHGKACLFTGGFNAKDDFNSAIKQISLAINITLKKNAETYTITDHGCN
jgi:transmembrane sensor